MAAQVTFSGEITYVHAKFIAVQEDDERSKRRWQVWGGTGNVGDRVTVTGELKTSVAKPREEGEIPKYVDHAVNNATISAQNSAQGSAVAEDPWGTDPRGYDNGGYPADTPF